MQHSDYKMSVSLPTQMMVGQIGSGTVKVLGSNGKGAANRKVYVAPTAFAGNAGVLRSIIGEKHNSGLSGSNGVLRFTYERITTGRVGFKATLYAPSSKTVKVSTTSYGHQGTVSCSYVDGVSAYADYTKHAIVDIKSTCDLGCEGVATVIFTAFHPAGAQTLKWTQKSGTTTARRWT